MSENNAPRWGIETRPAFDRATRKLDPSTVARIMRALQELCELDDPTARLKPLRHTKAGLWRLRVGDYRVIISVHRTEVVVVAVDVGHRSKVYD